MVGNGRYNILSHTVGYTFSTLWIDYSHNSLSNQRLSLRSNAWNSIIQTAIDKNYPQPNHKNFNKAFTPEKWEGIIKISSNELLIRQWSPTHQ